MLFVNKEASWLCFDFVPKGTSNANTLQDVYLHKISVLNRMHAHLSKPFFQHILLDLS